MYHSSKSTLDTYYALRIRRSNLKYTTQQELQKILFEFIVAMGVHLVDYGFHLGGRYRQCHLHALFQGKLQGRYLQMGQFNLYWEPCKNRVAYDMYMHKEDKNRQAVKDNMATINYYQHNLNNYI